MSDGGQPKRTVLIADDGRTTRALTRMGVVAEGVETEAQAAILRELAREGMDGFVRSRPGPIEEIPAVLHQAPRLPA